MFSTDASQTWMQTEFNPFSRQRNFRVKAVYLPQEIQCFRLGKRCDAGLLDTSRSVFGREFDNAAVRNAGHSAVTYINCFIRNCVVAGQCKPTNCGAYIRIASQPVDKLEAFFCTGLEAAHIDHAFIGSVKESINSAFK